MIDFVDTHPFLRIAFWVAMETMYFRIAQISFYDKMFLKLGVRMKDMAPM